MNTSIHLNIGSNNGDRRRDFIRRAVAAISTPSFLERIGTDASVQCSDFVDSAPWGYDSDKVFSNIGVLITGHRRAPWTQDELLAFLDAVQAVERSISSVPHRNADGTYRDRDLDIDIIAVDSIVLQHPRLQLPHPHMAQRDFVLRPLLQLDPGWLHPATGQPPALLFPTI